MYLLSLSVICLSTLICYSQGANNGFFQFGEMYKDYFIDDFKKLSNITLLNHHAEFKQNDFKGDLRLERGLLTTDLNVKFEKDYILKQDNSVLPKGAIRGAKFFYRFSIPKISLRYFYVLQATGKSIKGILKITLKEQIIEVMLEAIIYQNRKCDLDDKEIEVNFSLDGCQLVYSQEVGGLGNILNKGKDAIEKFVKETLMQTVSNEIGGKLKLMHAPPIVKPQMKRKLCQL